MRRRPRLHVLFAGLAALTLVVGSAPPAAVACSCAGPDVIIPELPASTTQVAFIGTPGLPTPAGVPVSVAGWYGGPAPSPEVLLAVTGGDGASCGRDAPMAGFAHLFVVYRRDDGTYGLSLCDVAAPLDTREGQALASQVASVMGEPVTVGAGPPIATEPVSTPASLAATIGSLLPTALTIVLAGLVVLGLFVWVSRRDEA